jgi:hypothetical protein
VNPAIISGGGHGSVDPSKWTRGQLLAVRGALFTARYPLPYGPRPNSPTNSLNMGAVFYYPNKSDRVKAFRFYREEKKYTHAPMGPWVPGFDQNYHGIYPQRVTTFEQHLDEIQELADNGIIAANFIKPDSWSSRDLDKWIMPAYRTPRARKLIRLAGPSGWEPGWETSNPEHVRNFQLVRQALPEAVLFLHLPADYDAPGTDQDFTPCANQFGQAVVGVDRPCSQHGLIDNPDFVGFAGAWQRMAAAGMDAFFAQVGGYWNDQQVVPTPGFLASFKNHWADLHNRFYNGHAGWPTHNDRGQQIRVGYAEGASYPNFNYDWPEQYALDLGDIAMLSGSDFYFDGGRVDVPKLED